MTTPTTVVRLSPSGKRIGNPPLTYGPGSIGLVFRKHGEPTTGSAAVALQTAGVWEVPGFGAPIAGTFAIDMTPGYKYDIEFDYEMQSNGLTTAATWLTYYRLRNAATLAFSAWVPFNGSSPHRINGTTTHVSDDRWASDAELAVDPGAVTYDQIQFGFTGDATALEYHPERSFARVVQYMP